MIGAIRRQIVCGTRKAQAGVGGYNLTFNSQGLSKELDRTAKRPPDGRPKLHASAGWNRPTKPIKHPSVNAFRWSDCQGPAGQQCEIKQDL